MKQSGPATSFASSKLVALLPLLLFLLLLVAPYARADFEAIDNDTASADEVGLHQVTFAVKQRNLDKLEEALLDVSTPGSPNYGKHWDRQAVADLTANPAASTAVLSFLSNQTGVSNITATVYGEYITAYALPRDWNAIFNTTLQRFRNPLTNTIIWRSLANHTLPQEIAEHVSLVYNVKYIPSFLPQQQPRTKIIGEADIPTQQQQQPTTSTTTSTTTTKHSNQTHSYLKVRPLASNPTVEYPNYITPSLINRIYGVTSNTALSSTSYAIYSTIGQSFSVSDFNAFATRFQLPTPPTIVERLSGGAGFRASETACLGDINDCAETSLDLQYIYAMAQGPQLIAWYDYAVDMFLSWITNVANTANPPQVISISYGMSETQIAKDPYARYLLQQFDTEAMKLGLQGTSILVSSGDQGSVGTYYSDTPTCSYDPSWPASSPYVTAVGATMGPELGTHVSLTETVCSAVSGSVITSGGGFSVIYGRPSWQSAAAAAYLTNTGQTFSGNADIGPFASSVGTRGLPDISLVGNKYLVTIGGVLYILSGTSASAPAFAGMVSLINSQRISAGQGALGWLNPTLYAAAASGQYSSLFNDVTTGSNNNYVSSTTRLPVTCAQGFAAAAGWDPSTGLGTPKFTSLAAYLVQQQQQGGSNPTTSPTLAPTSRPSPSPSARPSSNPSPNPTPSPSASPFPIASPTLAPVAAAVSCSPGSFSSNGVSPCTLCSSGYYQPYSGQQQSCSQVPAGNYATGPDGFATSSGATGYAVCLSGYTSTAGATACTQISYPTPFPAAAPCSAGTFSTTGTAPCSPCESGTYQDSAGRTACSQAPPGTYASFNGIATSSGATGFSPCGAGAFSDSGSSACTPCGPGHFSFEPGQASCTQVPAGSYATINQSPVNSGATGSTSCPVGTCSGAGSSACSLCGPGTYADKSGSTSCTVVPPGSFATLSNGQYASGSGASGSSQCGPGYFSPGGPGVTACSPCPAGTFATNPGSYYCSQVPAGNYATGANGIATSSGATAYSPCNAGYTSTAGATACTPCPDGTFYTIGATGLTSCSQFAPPTSTPTTVPTPSPTSGAISLAVQLSFSGLTREVISADFTGSITVALQQSVAAALGITSQLSTGGATMSAPVWSFATSLTFSSSFSSSSSAFLSMQSRGLEEEQRGEGGGGEGKRGLQATVAQAALQVTAFSSDLTGGSSSAEIAATLTAAQSAITTALKQQTGVDVGFVGVSAVVAVPSQVPPAPPALAPSGGGGTAPSTTTTTSSSSGASNIILIGGVAGGAGVLLLALAAWSCARWRARAGAGGKSVASAGDTKGISISSSTSKSSRNVNAQGKGARQGKYTAASQVSEELEANSGAVADADADADADDDDDDADAVYENEYDGVDIKLSGSLTAPEEEGECRLGASLDPSCPAYPYDADADTNDDAADAHYISHPSPAAPAPAPASTPTLALAENQGMSDSDTATIGTSQDQDQDQQLPHASAAPAAGGPGTGTTIVTMLSESSKGKVMRGKERSLQLAELGKTMRLT